MKGTRTGSTWLTIGQAVCVLLIVASLGVSLGVGNELATAYADGGIESIEEHFRYLYAWKGLGEYEVDPDVDTAVAVKAGLLVYGSFLAVGLIALVALWWLNRVRRGQGQN